MKKAVLFLCLLCCFAFLVIVGWPVKTLSFFDIPVLSDSQLSALLTARTNLQLDLLAITANGEPLPVDDATDTWYSPALTNAVVLEMPQPWKIARTATSSDPTDGDTCRIICYNDRHYIEYTLVETGLPVVSVTLRRFDLDPRYIGTSRTAASANILSLTEDGSLQWQMDRIEIKMRGGSSLSYPKKSYTLFFLDTSGTPALRSPLGLPADRKFALNSLYEDESKIRDALAYRLWSKIEPDNALQFTYTELVIDEEYYGLYGMHGLPTENSLPYADGDTIYKINSDLEIAPSLYRGEYLPAYEIVAGNAQTAPSIYDFLSPYLAPITAFPVFYDRDNFVNFCALMEVLACEDTSLKNLLLTYDASDGKYRLTGWDMDQSFGNVWNDASPLQVSANMSLAEVRYLGPSEQILKPLSILYASCPDFAADIATSYRELRQTIFTDEALLKEAAALYDLLTACGARARDAVRWSNSAISKDNSFIEEFIPARMAFLDSEFARID